MEDAVLALRANEDVVLAVDATESEGFGFRTFVVGARIPFRCNTIVSIEDCGVVGSHKLLNRGAAVEDAFARGGIPKREAAGAKHGGVCDFAVCVPALIFEQVEATDAGVVGG